MDIEHGTEIFKCDLCGETCTTRNDLNCRIDIKHGPETSQCDDCGHNAVSEATGREHIT